MDFQKEIEFHIRTILENAYGTSRVAEQDMQIVPQKRFGQYEVTVPSTNLGPVIVDVNAYLSEVNPLPKKDSGFSDQEASLIDKKYARALGRPASIVGLI